MVKIHFISYGDDNFIESKKRIKKEAENFGEFDTIKIYGPDKLTNEFKLKFKNILKEKKGGGYWIWKFDIIRQRLNEIDENDFLIYLDAGCKFFNGGKVRFKEYLEMLNKSIYDIISFRIKKLEKFITVKEIFNYFNIPITSKICNTGQIIGGVLVMKKRKHIDIILNETIRAIESDNNLVTDFYSDKEQYQFFRYNRHDQSLFSVIRKKFGSIIIKDESNLRYGKNNPFRALRIRK